MYDVVLIEKPVGCGLKKTEVLDLFDTLTSDEAYPVEIEAEKHESSAMGLITTQAAEKLDFNYAGLSHFVSSILDDMDLENDSFSYDFKGVSIFLSLGDVIE